MALDFSRNSVRIRYWIVYTLGSVVLSNNRQPKRPINQSINQSTIQSIIRRSVSQLVNQSVNQKIYKGNGDMDEIK